MLSHTNAVVARIQTIPALAAKTFKLVAPRDAAGAVTAIAPYVVVQPADGTDSRPRFMGPLTQFAPRIVLHIVGTSYDNAQTVAELVKLKFVSALGVPIQVDVTGQKGSHLMWDSPMPTQVDNDVTPPLIYNTVELTWVSTLA